MRSALRRVVLSTAALAAVLLAPGQASAAPWCGTAAAGDRPSVLTGYPIRVVYAVASDGVDRSAALAPRIWSDVEEIDAWWRANDPTRTPNFDLARFACGTQVDLGFRRLRSAAAAFTPSAPRFARLRDDFFAPRGLDAFFSKYLVYYDGPVEDEELCGDGGGAISGTGLAVVYLQACPGIDSAPVAVHQLLHSLGALFRISAPNACPDDAVHVCDSPHDILYSEARSLSLPLSSYVLDAGRDDYYGHAHPWFDVRSSRWMRRLDGSTPLSVVVQGRGSVRSDVPGLLCAVSCRTAWNPGEAIILIARPASGQRFVRWGGACFGRFGSCDVLLDRATSVTAVFAPARYRLTVHVSGRGRVTGAVPCAAGSCVRAVRSHTPATLRASPARGWRLKGWSGACRGAASTCTVPMTGLSTVRATFVRRA